MWDGCSAHQSILRPKENGGAGGVFADGVTINKGALLDIFRATGAVGQILFCCITFKCLTMCIVIITATITRKLATQSLQKPQHRNNSQSAMNFQCELLKIDVGAAPLQNPLLHPAPTSSGPFPRGSKCNASSAPGLERPVTVC